MHLPLACELRWCQHVKPKDYKLQNRGNLHELVTGAWICCWLQYSNQLNSCYSTSFVLPGMGPWQNIAALARLHAQNDTVPSNRDDSKFCSRMFMTQFQLGAPCGSQRVYYISNVYIYIQYIYIYIYISIYYYTLGLSMLYRYQQTSPNDPSNGSLHTFL